MSARDQNVGPGIGTSGGVGEIGVGEIGVGGIGVVVLTYESAPELLMLCLRSVVHEWANSRDADPIVDIVVADNASPTLARQTAELVDSLVVETGAPIRFSSLGENHGFAGGVNRATRSLHPEADLVFLLNPDAEVEAGAIRACATALRSESELTVSAAPKMLRSVSTFPEPTIDAVSNAVNEKGEAFNIGLGQPDLGQYDVAKHCFGPCFGAALFRRSAFGPDFVGELNESLFMYYEDVEWNWRAQILGFSSITVPTARVRHVMSASTRDRPYDFKFRLTERNLLIVALQCIPGVIAYRIVFRRVLGLLRGSVRGHYPVAGLRAVGGLARSLPRAMHRRREIQRRRRRSHDDILLYGRGERTFFDAVRYVPTDGSAARKFAEQKTSEFLG